MEVKGAASHHQVGMSEEKVTTESADSQTAGCSLFDDHQQDTRFTPYSLHRVEVSLKFTIDQLVSADYCHYSSSVYINDCD